MTDIIYIKIYNESIPIILKHNILRLHDNLDKYKNYNYKKEYYKSYNIDKNYSFIGLDVYKLFLDNCIGNIKNGIILSNKKEIKNISKYITNIIHTPKNYNIDIDISTMNINGYLFLSNLIYLYILYKDNLLFNFNINLENFPENYKLLLQNNMNILENGIRNEIITDNQRWRMNLHDWCFWENYNNIKFIDYSDHIKNIYNNYIFDKCHKCLVNKFINDIKQYIIKWNI